MPGTMKLIAPRGYGTIVPLEPRRHGGMGMGLRPGADHRWAAALNAVPIGAAEFFRAGLDYPIAFAREERNGEFVPVVALGLRPQQNLFVAPSGTWRPHTYIPAHIRRFPFCITPVPPDEKGASPQPLICVQEDQLATDSAHPLFTRNGEPTPAWAPILGLLEAVEGARQQTRVLCRRLEALELLVPFEAVATPRQGEPLRMQGLHRVDEERLTRVPGRDLRTMMRKGELRAVYSHLNSLENFGRLLDLDPSSNPGSGKA